MVDPTKEQLLQDSIRAVSVEPMTWAEEDYSVDVVFSTGAPATKFDFRAEMPYIEVLPLSGMDLSTLNSGAHVLRNHGMDDPTIEGIIGSVIPGTAKVVGSEARARIQLSKEESDAEVVNKIKTGIIRKLSYGYQKIGSPVVTYDELTGAEIRTWEQHRPYELSFVPIPADAGTGTRSAAAEFDNPKKEESMETTETRTETRTETTSAVQPEVNLDEVRAQAVKLENDRQVGIRSAAKKLGIEDNTVEAMLADTSMTLDAARARLIDAIAKKDAKMETHTQVDVLTDSREQKFAGMEEALVYRARGIGSPTERAKAFMHYSLKDVASECVRAAGKNTDGMSASQIFDEALFGRRAFSATTDFASVLANVQNKVFVAAYMGEERNFAPLGVRRLVKDYKPVAEVQLGALSVPVVAEGDEIQGTTPSDSHETGAILSHGRLWSVTRQALVNDDLGAFGSMPQQLAASCVSTELNTVWELFTANGNLSDGEAWFSAAHANATLSGGAAPSVSEIAKGRALLRKAKDQDGQFLGLTPAFLVVPAALESTADQLVAQITANQASAVTPAMIRNLQVIVEPRLDAVSEVIWYLVANPNRMPAFAYGYLTGEETPRISSREAWEIRGLEMKVEMDFGAWKVAYQPVYRNNGAA